LEYILKIWQEQCFNYSYLATRSTQGTIRGNCDGVQVTSVVIVILLKTAIGQIPDLDHTIPATGYNNGVVVVGGEPHAGNPISVTFLLQRTGLDGIQQSLNK
jgi:hypothetical protein